MGMQPTGIRISGFLLYLHINKEKPQMTRKYLIAFLLFVSAASTALAQFTPVVSKVGQTKKR
jgi:hypothetical protein